LQHYAIADLLVVEDKRPNSPALVFPSMTKLIRDCWAHKTDDRPSFNKSPGRLEEMEFNASLNVKASKLPAFVKTVKTWQAANTNPVIALGR
jgi:hypothetical protein